MHSSCASAIAAHGYDVVLASVKQFDDAFRVDAFGNAILYRSFIVKSLYVLIGKFRFFQFSKLEFIYVFANTPSDAVLYASDELFSAAFPFKPPWSFADTPMLPIQ